MKEIREVHKSDERKQFFVDMIAKFCDKCGSPYSVNDLEIIQDTNISSIIHFSCNNCKSGHIATYLKPLGMSNSTPINTDLSVEEVSKFARRDETSTDDVLEIYTYLKKRTKVVI
jgi:hypothetical protein